MNPAERPYNHTGEEVLDALGVASADGLSPEEAGKRLTQYGRNRVGEAKTAGAWAILLNQFRSLIVLLLAAAGGLSLAFGDVPEFIAIIVVIIINAGIGFFTELRAARSMEALGKMVRIETTVRRGGGTHALPAEELVPGDIVVLEAGDVAPADMRLVKASGVEADESSLTGESVPVHKNTEPLRGDPVLADRTNMVYMGTALTRGSAEAVVTATGKETELGRIGKLVEGAGHEKTPLEKNLDKLGNNLIWVTLFTAAFVIATGILRGREVFLMVETGIALAVAAIPEGLPVVATIALARGMMRMARMNALVNRLSAVETLGSTSVICTDKTGTLTENKMTVEMIVADGAKLEIKRTNEGIEFLINGEKADLSENDVIRRALEVGVLCNTVPVDYDGEGVKAGDPMETALVSAGREAGIEKAALLERFPEIELVAFDSAVNMMATVHRADGAYRTAVKGAPGSVLGASASILTPSGERELTDEDRETWKKRNEELAGKGYRVIAHAEKRTDGQPENPYEGLTFLGLVCLLDPPRPDVKDAIEKCIEAGIKVVMVTGDHPSTAKNIALAVGLVDDRNVKPLHGSIIKNVEGISDEDSEMVSDSLIIARVSPEQKLELVKMKQENGLVVAMTGDGVNDAPALRQADIGIAMGLRGTQVAREAADIVLKDDSFGTIVSAVEQGRIIYGNIKKFIFYLISCNVSEIMVVTFASFALIPLPILPLQILFLNLVTDIFPALALGMGEGDEHIMKEPPRDPKEPLVSRRGWLGIAGYGMLLTVAVLGALLFAIYGLGYSDDEAVSVSFLTLAFAQLFHVFNMRDRGSKLIGNEITRNLYVWGALALCSLLIAAAVYVAPLADVLKVIPPGGDGWTLVLAMSLLPALIGQAIKSAGTKSPAQSA